MAETSLRPRREGRHRARRRTSRGRRTTDPDGADLAAKIGSMAPGTAVKIGIFRNGNEHTVSVTLGELPVTPFKPAAAPQQQEPSRLGLTLAPAATIKGAGSQE